jgi:hypothetical protein
MFGAAVAATIALVFPAQALATATSTTVYAGGTTNVVSSMQADDLIDLTATAPNDFDISSQVSRDVTRSTLGFNWSSESLQLQTSSSFTTPEGWGLEYTTNGTTWSSTKPSDFSKISGVRANSTYTKTGANEFQSTTTATLLATAADFAGGGGGDGFDVTFVDDRIYTVYHHGSSIALNCFLKATGTRCPNGSKTFTGYTTPNSAHAWVNAAGDKLFVPSYKATTSSIGVVGVVCINISDPTNPGLCSGATGTAFSPFISLGANNNLQNTGGAAQVGQKLFIPNPYNWTLTCFDMATGLECSGNGYVSGGVEISATVNRTTSPWTIYGRAINIDEKVFWSSDTHLGCYDPTTAGFCGGNAPVLIGSSTNTVSNLYSNNLNQFPMFPVYDSSATLLGACYFASEQCFTPSGAVTTTILPTALRTWMRVHPLPNWITSDSGVLGLNANRIYFPVGPSSSATSSVYCFDYTTGAACSQFGTNGTKTGVATEVYSIQSDPDPLQPNCMWVNSNSGTITTFNATTGVAGCASSQATVKLGYKQLFPRMGCAEASRVSGWGLMAFNSPGVSASVLRVTVKNSAGVSITGYTNRLLSDIDAGDVNGYLDLRGLSIADSGTKPTILVTADLNTAGTLLSQLTAKINYSSAEPQVCVVLRAKIQCETAYTSPTGPTSVGDGTITTIASYRTTRYVGTTPTEFAEVTESNRQTVTGTGTATCAASVGGGGGGGSVTVLPVPTAPKAKRPPVTITIGGFRDGSPILTKTIQNKIKAFLKKYNDYPVIETAGFTEGPVVLKTDFALSKARAVNATTFIKKDLKKKFSVVKIKSGQDKVEASKVRRIKITLTDE